MFHLARILSRAITTWILCFHISNHASNSDVRIPFGFGDCGLSSPREGEHEKEKSALSCSGLQTKTPHLSSKQQPDSITLSRSPNNSRNGKRCASLKPAKSVIDDANKGRYFAYLTRWRQPERVELRYFVRVVRCEQSLVPHIVSGELPNSFSAMWKKVDRVVFDGNGALDRKQLGLSGEEFTTMDTLNHTAHAPSGTIVTCIGVSRNLEKWKPRIEKHISYWNLLCNNLDRIEKGLKRQEPPTTCSTEFKQSRASVQNQA